MKRLICMILAMLMIVSMVCVVGGQEDEEELPSPPPQEVKELTEELPAPEEKEEDEREVRELTEELKPKKGFFEKILHWIKGLFGIEAPAEEEEAVIAEEEEEALSPINLQATVKEVKDQLSFELTANLEEKLEEVLQTADKIGGPVMVRDIEDIVTDPEVTQSEKAFETALDNILDAKDDLSTEIGRESFIQDVKDDARSGLADDLISAAKVQDVSLEDATVIKESEEKIPVTLMVTRELADGTQVPASNVLVQFENRDYFTFSPEETRTNAQGEATTEVTPNTLQEEFVFAEIYADIKDEEGAKSSSADVIVAGEDNEILASAIEEALQPGYTETEKEPDVKYVEYPPGSEEFIPEDEVPDPQSLMGG